MKKRVPILNNPIYAEILFAITDKASYPTEIATRLNKHRPTIQKQLFVLNDYGEKTGNEYVLAEENPKRKNIFLYKINWSKILDDYLNYVYQEGSMNIKNFDGFKSFLSKNNKTLIKNKLIQKILSDWVNNYSKMVLPSKNKIHTLLSCFANSWGYFKMYYEDYKRGVDKLKKPEEYSKKDWSEFLVFISYFEPPEMIKHDTLKINFNP